MYLEKLKRYMHVHIIRNRKYKLLKVGSYRQTLFFTSAANIYKISIKPNFFVYPINIYKFVSLDFNYYPNETIMKSLLFETDIDFFIFT